MGKAAAPPGRDDRVLSLQAAHRKFRDELVGVGLLILMANDGLYGSTAAFEEIIDGISRVIRRKARSVHGDRPTVMRFPPVYPSETFERTGYISSFPQLMGAVVTFTGDNAAHRALLADCDAGRGWDGHLKPAGAMLVSAACHPSYAAVAPALPDAGELLDVFGYCFRREPAIDPLRMQSFRMREYVMIGTPQQAQDHRRGWVTHGLEVLDELGLSARPAAANDPFFGRAGAILATGQLEDDLKTELVVRLHGDLDGGTALFSANYHRDHFGHAFGLSTPDGAIAHSACAAFGMERVALAMLRTHGVDPGSWPEHVRAALRFPSKPTE